MKNFKAILSSILIMAALAGCSKWNQDPLTGLEGNLQDGRNTPTGEAPKPGTPSDNIRIDTVDNYSFQEGTEGSFIITARMLVPGYETSIDFVNLESFPGAQFDPATGTFSWTPPVGTSAGPGLHVKELLIRVTAEREGYVSQVRVEGRQISVTKMTTAPEVISTTGPKTLREGEMGFFKVLVRDRSAAEGISATWPSLMTMAPSYGRNLSGYLTVSDVKSLGKGEFEFTLKVSLTNEEVSDSVEVYQADLIAYSSSGVRSVSKNISINFYTSFSKIQSTWWESVTAVIGKPLRYQFTIYDPKDEVALSNPVFSNLPGGALVDCKMDYPLKSRYRCVLSWTPDVSMPVATIKIKAKVELRNVHYADTYRETQELEFRLVTVADESANSHSVVGGLQ